MNDETRKNMGLKLKEAREYLNISQEVAAKVANISRSAVSLIENGNRKLDSIELIALAKLYQRPISFFTSSDENLSTASSRQTAVLARNYETLSENDQSELMQFSEFLAAKSKGKS